VRKLLVPAAGLLALSLLLSACGAPLTPYAARVNSATISPSELNAAMASIANDPGYRCEVVASASSSGSQVAIEGKGNSTYASSFAADVLTQLVQYAAAHQEVEHLGLAEGSFARQLAASQLPQAFTPSSTSGCSETGAQILSGFSPSYRSVISQFELDQLVLLAHLGGVTLTKAGVASYEASHASASTLSCTSIIEVATKTAATAAAKQIAAGATFASIAHSESTDASSSSGGSLGCIFASQFTAPLNTVVANLAIGTVSAPVPFGTSYLLITVTSRPLASVTEVASQLLLAQQAKLTTLLSSATGAAHVSIDPTYGSWHHATTGWSVGPSNSPADALLPTPAAVTPVAATSTAAAAAGSSG
jgi:PPIC-type PPIASE domain